MEHRGAGWIGRPQVDGGETISPIIGAALSAAAPSPGAKIADHLARRVMARSPGDAAARVGRGAAHVKARNGRSIIGMPENRPCRIELVEAELPMKNITANEAELALEIERREDLARNNRRFEARRIGFDRVDHEIGDRLARLVP
jgi:hypothetical protein